jgi:hypothetical protein
VNKKKKIIGVAAVLAICLAIAIPVGRGKFNFDDKFKIAENFKANSSKNDAENGKLGDTNNIDGNIGSGSSKDSVSDGKNQDSNSPNGNNYSGSNINNNETDQNNVGNQNNVGGNSNSGNQNTGGVSGDGSITDFDNTGETIKDNYEVNDADIKIQHINSYSGIFIEDGSDVEVDNVAAIQVKNTSKKALEFAQIQIYNGDKKLVFDVSSLPANSSAIIMEKNKAPLDKSKSITYGGTTGGYTNKLEKDATIKYQKIDNNGIKVTNKSNKNIPCVRIFYKYKSSEGYYIGGITYTAKINNIKAKESQTIYPSHFDSDGGEIMMIKTYTTAQ